MRHLSFRYSLLIVLLYSDASPVWAQRDLKNVPDPDPELERRTFVVPDGFEVNLYAGDPLLAKPVQMNFDAQGRLWIASSEVYPQIKPGQPMTDKILVLDDANRDGRADKTTVFADGLLIPTGVMPGDGGAYVANSTELIHLRDTDGDGRADVRRVVLSGFGTEDTHHLLHTLRWGPDSCLYMNQSIYIHSHIETPYGVKRLNGGGIWRFRPESLRLDVLCHGFVNTWGHHFDRYGQSFATDGAYGEGINYVFPGSVFVTAPGAVRTVQGLNPGSPKHCGLEIVSGGHLPADWQGNMLTNDFRAHRVCRFVVTEDGSGYASRQEVEVIKSNHPAFRPIDVKMGPDGAIYIADWYNPIIQHGEVDFRDERRDHVHGRIWRVTAKGRPLLDTRIAADATPAQLLEKLRVPEEWTRQHAKLMLKAHGAAATAPLAQWLAGLDKSAVDFDALRLEALWVYEGLDLVNQPLVESLLRSADHRVRAAALRVVAHWIDPLPNAAAHLRAAATDAHPRVRLEAVRGLALIPHVASAAAVAKALDQPSDRFLDFALWQTMRDLAPVWLPAVRDGSFDFSGRLDHLTFALKSADAPGAVQPLLQLVSQRKVPADRWPGLLSLAAELGNAEELGKVLDLVLSPQAEIPADKQADILAAVVKGSQLRKARPAGELARIGALLASPQDRLASAAAEGVGLWKLEQFRPQLVTVVKQAQGPSPRTQAALDALAALGGEESAKILSDLARTAADVAVRQQSIGALAATDVAAAASAAVELIAADAKNADPAGLVVLIVSKKEGPAALTAALAKAELTPDAARQVLRGVRASSQSSPELIAAVQQAGKLADAGWKFTPEFVQEIAEEVQSSGDPARGEEIFRRKENQCLKCHAIGGAGGIVGPDLVSIGATAQLDYLVESLLVPAAKVKENFHSLLIATDDGRVVTGIPVRETNAELALRDADDKVVTIAKNAIENRKPGRSLMPDGTVDALTRAELVDLVRFLSELGKVGDYSLAKTRLARRFETLVWSPRAHQRLNRTSHDTAATDDEVFSWEPAYSRVNGSLPWDSLPQFTIHQGQPATTFVRCEIDVTTAGALRLQLADPRGLAVWVDGKPTPAAAEIPLQLAVGRHRVLFVIDRQVRQSPLQVELLDGATAVAQAQFVQGK